MPVLRFKLERLYNLIGLGLDELSEALFNLKCESEIVGDYLEVEVNADRPDMFIGDGIKRAVKGLLGLELGWRKPEIVDSGLQMVVENVPVRPYIVAAVVYNANIDNEDYLEELIQFQEKLHDGLGRGRRKAAIGLHDADKIPDKNLKYTMTSIDTMFKPLNYPRPMKAREILEYDEKGRAYGWISRVGDMHPFIFSGDEVITMPPVLNSDITSLEVGTRNVFIDVTSTDLWTAEVVLNIIVSNLAERLGAYVGLVHVIAPWGGIYPRLTTRTTTLSSSELNNILGTSFKPEELGELLERMRYNVKISGEVLEVEVPPFRIDVSRAVDLAEDIAIAVGYENLGPRNLWPSMRGYYSDITRISRALRMTMTGLGFTEVMRLSLTSSKLLDILGLRSSALEVANPVQVEYSLLRPSLAVTLLELLLENKHAPKPVKVFEIGPVILKTGEGIVEDERIGLAVMDDEVSYEDVQAPVYYMLRILGLDFETRPMLTPYTIEGRTGEIVSSGRSIGVLGEVKPEVLELLNLEYPVAIAELSLQKLSILLKLSKSS